MKLDFHRNWLGMGGVLSGTALILCGVIGVVLTVLMLGTAALLAWKRRWRDAAITVLMLLAGMLSAWYAVRTYQAPEHDRRGIFAVRITDANAVGVIPGDEEALEYRVIAEIPDGTVTRTVLISFSGKCPNPGVMAGELREVTGILRRADLPTEYWQLRPDNRWADRTPHLEHGSFQHYLAAREISATLTVERISAPLPEEGAGALAKLRRWLLLRLDRGIASPRHRAILGAITLGMRGRLTPHYKTEFQRAGVAHLFSVSGLHVGVLAGLFLLLLRPLPGIWHIVVALSLGGYVIMTGGNAPAIRALALLAAAEFLRHKALYVHPLEILGLIGAALLLIQPFYLTDAGFQFSFVVTGFLIAAATPAREIALAGRGDALRVGEFSPRQKRFYRWRGAFLAAIFVAAAASAGGMALSLYHQSYYFAGAMLVNLLVLPILAPLFALAVLKCIFPGWGMVLNPALTALLRWLDGCIEWGQSAAPLNEYAVPGAVSVIAFGVLLAVMLVWRRRWWGVAAAGGVLLWIALRIWCAAAAPAAIGIFISGGSLTDPVLAILEPCSHAMKVCNAGRAGVFPLRTVAQHYGISRITELGFGRASIHTVDGLDELKKSFIVEAIRLPARPVRSKPFKSLLAHEGNLRQGAPERELVQMGAGASRKIAWCLLPDGTYQVDFGSRSVRLERTAAVRVHLVEFFP